MMVLHTPYSRSMNTPGASYPFLVLQVEISAKSNGIWVWVPVSFGVIAG